MDFSKNSTNQEDRKRHQAFVDLMIPVVKGWSTETGIEVASLGIQVHGGMGFIEETGAAQHLRDARIATIYEGTTGIQANDLIGRKIAREGGATARAWLKTLARLDAELAKSARPDVARVRATLAAGAKAVGESVDWLLATFGSDVKAASAGAVPSPRARATGRSTRRKSPPRASTPTTCWCRRRGCATRCSTAAPARWRSTRSSSSPPDAPTLRASGSPWCSCW
jgi:hypothetical protein